MQEDIEGTLGVASRLLLFRHEKDVSRALARGEMLIQKLAVEIKSTNWNIL